MIDKDTNNSERFARAWQKFKAKIAVLTGRQRNIIKNYDKKITEKQLSKIRNQLK